MPMEIEYSLTGAGSAECRIRSGIEQAKIAASYLSDALGNLATCTLSLLKGKRTAWFYFDLEQGSFRWLLERKGEELNCGVYWFGQLWDGPPDKVGSRVFDATVPLAEYVQATHRALASVLATHGLAGYKEKWVEFEFPEETFKQITALLAANG